jgi:hypothetical protein
MFSSPRFFKQKHWRDSIFPNYRHPAVASLNNALSYAQKTNDTSMRVFAGVILAKTLLHEKKYSEAFYNINKALSLDTMLPVLSPVRQFLYRDACQFYHTFGTYKIAAFYLRKAIDISVKRDSVATVRLYGLYSSYANLCRKMGLMDSCLFYNLKAIEMGSKLESQWEASGLNNYGMLLLDSAREDSALRTFELAKKTLVREPLKDSGFFYSVSDNMAEVYARKKMYATALPLFNGKYSYVFKKRNGIQIFNAGLRSGMMMLYLGNFSGVLQRVHVLDSVMLVHGQALPRGKKEELARLKFEFAMKTGNAADAIRLQQEIIDLKMKELADAEKDKLGMLESVLLENREHFNKELEVEKLRSEESSARAAFNKTLAAGAAVTGVLIIAIILILYRRKITTESYRRELAESNLKNEQLGKSQLKQQLELNRVTVEQESYKRELAEINLKNEQLEKEYFSQQLELKKRDVTDYALAYSQRKKILDEVLNKLKDIKKSEDPVQQLQELGKTLKKQLQGDAYMEIDPGRIEQVNHEFFEKLENVCPDLTPGEKDLTGLIRLNFSSKEISSLRNISPASVRISKFRLKKKLGLSPELDLTEFIQKL